MFGIIFWGGTDYCVWKETENGSRRRMTEKEDGIALPFFESPLARDFVDFLAKHGGEREREREILTHRSSQEGGVDFPD